MMIISHWYNWYNIKVHGWIFFKLGEAKITIDSHHTTLSKFLLYFDFDFNSYFIFFIKVN